MICSSDQAAWSCGLRDILGGRSCTDAPVVALVSALALSTLSTGIAAAHPDQHGVNDGHLLGPGEGKIDLLGVVELTQTEGLIADVTVSPDGDTAFLNWGEPDCAGPESGGQTSPDAGAYVVDISNIETDPGSAELIGFIPSHQDTRPGEGMQVVEITTSSFSGDVLVMNNEACGKNAKGRITVGRHRPDETQEALGTLR